MVERMWVGTALSADWMRPSRWTRVYAAYAAGAVTHLPTHLHHRIKVETPTLRLDELGLNREGTDLQPADEDAFVGRPCQSCMMRERRRFIMFLQLSAAHGSRAAGCHLLQGGTILLVRA